MANQAEVIRILTSIRDATDITIESSVRDRLIEVIGQALDTRKISADEIVAFYEGQTTIASGTVELLARIKGVGVGETTRELPPPISPGVQAPVGGTPTAPQQTEPADENLAPLAGDADAIMELWGDPDLVNAPQELLNFIVRMEDASGFEGGFVWIFGDYNAETGELIAFNGRSEPSTYIVTNGQIVPKEIIGAGGADDIARSNLLNMQMAQIQALMDGDLIPLADGRSILKGTTTIIDTRTPGQFAPIEGIPGTFYDPVTGAFIDQNGQQLARDRFEFEQNFIFPEEQRQFDEQLTLDRENITSANRRQVLSSLVDLQGQRDARGIAGAMAAQDPGNFVAAENIRRGLAPPVQGETPLFQDVDFDGFGLADIIGLLSGEGGGQAPAEGGLASSVTGGIGGTSGVGAQGTGFPPEVQAVLDKAVQDAAIANALKASAAEADAPVGSNVDPEELARLQEIARQGNLSNIIKPQQQAPLQQAPLVATPVQEAEGDLLRAIGEGGGSFAEGGATTAPVFQVGDPVPGTNKPNPEVILNPENAPIQVIRLSDIVQNMPKFFAGTSTGLGTASDPQDFPQLRQDPTAPVARTTADVDIQQTPGLRFIQGGQGAEEDFNRLSTSTIQGPFGTGLPLAGALNFARAQEALQDPITGPLLSSLFRAASLDFAGEVARARKRAPTGQSLATSLVRT